MTPKKSKPISITSRAPVVHLHHYGESGVTFCGRILVGTTRLAQSFEYEITCKHCLRKLSGWDAANSRRNQERAAASEAGARASFALYAHRAGDARAWEQLEVGEREGWVAVYDSLRPIGGKP